MMRPFLLVACLAMAQGPPVEAPKVEARKAISDEPPESPVEWVCPMDPDVRSNNPGKCSRCGMKLEAGLPDPIEYPVRIRATPRGMRAGAKTELRFEVLDPKTGKRVERFALVHEKLFHLFLISQDLTYFAHEHPELLPDSSFRFEARFPKPGPYRVLCDFYPEGATPQLAVKTLIVAGAAPAPAQLAADLAPKKGENIDVELVTEPPQPLARKKTLLFFKVKPHEGLEPYLGAWGHLLSASADLIDLVHLHPAFNDSGPQIQFNAIFPRPGVYRIWVQFQRQGVVNTVAFNLPVASL